MCGILGVRRSFLDDEARFRSAAAAMEWRGPDGMAMVDAGDWRLAVARLAISDPHHGQPLWSQDGRRVIAFNGVVTSADLERQDFGDLLSTGNDAELALQRLARDGESALLRTAGHYALAIIQPEGDHLWLARDPEGEKPLFVVRRGEAVVAFASTLASLRRLGIELEFDEPGLARFFRFGFGLRPVIKKAGMGLESDLRGLCHQAEGAATEHLDPMPPTPSTSLPVALAAATRRCATAEVPVGLCLSGGVDSACLAAVLAAADHALPAYQFRAAGSSSGERDRAELVALHTGMDLRPVDAGPEILQQLPKLTGMAGMPLGDPSVLAVHALARQARRDGVRVLLSGEGADELFLGYRRHRVARRLPRRGPLRWPLAWSGGGVSMTTPMRVLRSLADPRPYDALLEVAPPGFRRAVLAAGLGEGALPEGPHGSSLDRARHTDRMVYLRSDLLPKLDTALMAAGIEGRCPFLDPAVANCEEARAVDPTTILGKRPLRDAYRDALPAGVLDGPKLGFGIPLDAWLREDDYLPDLLMDRRTRERAHLRPAGLRQMLDAHRAGRHHLGHALYLVAAMECHLRDLETTPQAAEVER